MERIGVGAPLPITHKVTVHSVRLGSNPYNGFGKKFYHYCGFFNFNFLLLFNYSCEPSLPIAAPHPSRTPPPSPQFCPCVLYSSSCNPLSSLSPPHYPLSILRLFLTSMSLVIFCFLFFSIYYVPVKGEIIWYLSLTSWLISLSIMLSSSIHAVAKGISSFFLSAA